MIGKLQYYFMKNARMTRILGSHNQYDALPLRELAILSTFCLRLLFRESLGLNLLRRLLQYT